MRTKVLLPDSGPLFSFVSVEGGLDLLLSPGLPIVLTDYIEWEATRSGSDSAKEIKAWIAGHRNQITIVNTELGQARIARELTGTVSKKDRRNIGEVTVFEALATGDVGDGPFLFLFEEDKFVDPGFYGRHPVHSVTTYGFLVGLERSGIIAAADEIFQAMRTNGREGIKAVIIDRAHRAERGGNDTTWRP